VLVVVFCFALTSINVLIVQGGRLTSEEAVEISRNSGLVAELLESAEWYTLEVYHLNQTQIDKIIEEYPYRHTLYPEEHGVWVIQWYIRPIGARSEFAVAHVIDEETGEITHEGWFSIR